MKAKLRNMAWSCLALLCGAASAQVRDGAYTGTLECGPLITNPQQGAWKQLININVTGQTVTWERPDPRITEVGSSTLRDRRVSFTLEGRWNPGQHNSGKWRNVVMLEWKDSALSGPATIFSANGDQRLRDCSVRVAMAPALNSTAGTRREVSPPAVNAPQVLSGLPAVAVAAARTATALPPVSGLAASAERTMREQETSRESEAIRERARDQYEQRLAQVRAEAERRGEISWEQQHQENKRKYEAEQKAREEQEKKRQLAWKQKEAREAQEHAAAQTQYETSAKGAAVRHADRIKALGLPATFVNATLYVNDMGNWTPFLPCSQWLGLLFDNPKIASVHAISVRGQPGVSIKRSGQPAGGIVFRMEGNEAYVWGMVSEGKAEEIRTPHEHTLIGMMLKEVTLDRSKP